MDTTGYVAAWGIGREGVRYMAVVCWGTCRESGSH